MKVLCLLWVLAAYCVLASSGVLAVQFTITDPQFTCPANYGSCSTLTEQSPLAEDLFWGVPVGGCDVHTDLGSGIQFLPNTANITINQCSPTNNITLGILKSRNAIIASNPGAPSNVNLTFNIVIDGNQVVPIIINIEIDETENTEPCAYPSTPGNPCADRHLYRILTTTWTTGDTTYRLSFNGSDTFTIIIQECVYDSSANVFTSPITLSIDIVPKTCCPVELSIVSPYDVQSTPNVTDVGMYLPMTINMYGNGSCACANTNISGGYVRGRLLLTNHGYLIKVITTRPYSSDVNADEVYTVDLSRGTQVIWEPHNVYPGKYEIVFQLENSVAICTHAPINLSVRPEGHYP